MAPPSIRSLNTLRSRKGGVIDLKLLDFFVGIATGIISGMGIGGGSLLVLYLTAVTGISQRTAGGINLLYFIGCAPTALIGHMKNKTIEWRAALWCTIAGVAVAIPISLLAGNLDSGWLRRLFGIFLLYIGIKELRLGKNKQE